MATAQILHKCGFRRNLVGFTRRTGVLIFTIKLSRDVLFLIVPYGALDGSGLFGVVNRLLEIKLRYHKNLF